MNTYKVVALILLLALANGQYYTNSVRTTTVEDLCAKFESRTELVNDQ